MEWLVDYKGSTEPDQSEILPNSGGLPRSLIANILQICCDSTGFHEETNERFEPGFEPQNEEEMSQLERRRAFPGAEPFLHTLPVLESSQVPLKFAHVSISWRQIVLETPRLWRRFQLSMEVGTNESANLGLQRLCQEANIWLARSGNCLLTFSLSISHSLDFFHFQESQETLALYESLFGTLSKHASRWRNVNFISQFNERSHRAYSNDTIAGISNTTKTFRVKLGPSFCPKSPFTSFISPKEGTPELQVFQFSLTGFTIVDFLLVSQNLTFLNLERGREHPSKILSLLKSVPNLRWLHFTSCPSDFDRGAHLVPVRHENLQMLFLSHRRSDQTRSSQLSGVLNLLTLPSLREVLLTDFFPATDAVLPALANMIKRSARRTHRLPGAGSPKEVIHRGLPQHRPNERMEQALLQVQSYTPHYLANEKMSYDYFDTCRIILAAMKAHPFSQSTNQHRNPANSDGRYRHEDLPRMVTFIHFRADCPEVLWNPMIYIRTPKWSGYVYESHWSYTIFIPNRFPESNFFVNHYTSQLDIDFSDSGSEGEYMDDEELQMQIDQDEEERIDNLGGDDY